MNPPPAPPASADPLAALPPLHLPHAIGWWPPAPGWWLLAILALAAVCALLWLALRRWRRDRLRRLARAQARELLRRYRAQDDAGAWLRDTNALLKRFVLQQFPHCGAAALSGEAWLHHLDSLSTQRLFSQGPGRQLLQVYAPAAQIDPNALHPVIERWLGSLRAAS